MIAMRASPARRTSLVVCAKKGFSKADSPSKPKSKPSPFPPSPPNPVAPLPPVRDLKIDPNYIPQRLEFDSDIEKDFWEDSRFGIIGKAAQYAVPILVLAAIGVGSYAASVYNDGAATFMTNARSDESSVAFFPKDEVLKVIVPSAK